MDKQIIITGVEPAWLAFRWPLGLSLDLRLTMRDQRGVPVNTGSTHPQLVLAPRSHGGTYPYDMEGYDPANGIARVSVPGASLTDRDGYNLEIYLRQENPVPEDPPLPTSLAAIGTIRTQGHAYDSTGPLYLINVPTIVGPPGPAGAPGAASTVPGPPGARGSLWFTGAGAPGVISGAQPADMYLDEANGDVYRYDGAMWTRGTF